MTCCYTNYMTGCQGEPTSQINHKTFRHFQLFYRRRDIGKRPLESCNVKPQARQQKAGPKQKSWFGGKDAIQILVICWVLCIEDLSFIYRRTSDIHLICNTVVETAIPVKCCGGALQRTDVTYFVILQARPFHDNHHDCHFCVYSLKSIVTYHQCEALFLFIMIFKPNESHTHEDQHVLY